MLKCERELTFPFLHIIVRGKWHSVKNDAKNIKPTHTLTYRSISAVFTFRQMVMTCMHTSDANRGSNHYTSGNMLCDFHQRQHQHVWFLVLITGISWHTFRPQNANSCHCMLNVWQDMNTGLFSFLFKPMSHCDWWSFRVNRAVNRKLSGSAKRQITSVPFFFTLQRNTDRQIDDSQSIKSKQAQNNTVRHEYRKNALAPNSSPSLDWTSTTKQLTPNMMKGNGAAVPLWHMMWKSTCQRCVQSTSDSHTHM